MEENIIEIQNCSVKTERGKTLQRLDWTVRSFGEAWLIAGENSAAKTDFLKALSGLADFSENEVPVSERTTKNEPFCHINAKHIQLVSLETAATVIEEERARDESEVLGFIDKGRTARTYIAEVLSGVPLDRIETLPAVKLCGVERFLDTGLRFLSTGEIRRTLLCRALLSHSDLIILSDPFSGLDVQSRSQFLEFFDTLLSRQCAGGSAGQKSAFPQIILSMERFFEIPSHINKVLAFSGNEISFLGSRADYEKSLKESNTPCEKKGILRSLKKIYEDAGYTLSAQKNETLVRFENVNVGYEGRPVLENVHWQVIEGEHWLIVGPNGSGKTTILELITGDNMQVFREQIYLFGSRRGSGETIWDIKKKVGIVSYRLHVEYRMVGGTSLRDVIISGFYDSIGLYAPPSDFEIAAARSWLSLSSLCKKNGSFITEDTPFSALSYGEQRVALLLRAAVKLPRLLILDEPCHGLSEAQRSLVLTVLEEIAAMGTSTLLHVTHDKSEILSCEHSVLELCPGKEPMYTVYTR